MPLDITVATELRGVKLYTDPTIEALSGRFDPASLHRVTMSGYMRADVELHLTPLVVPTRASEGTESRWYGLDPKGYNAVAQELGTDTRMGDDPTTSSYFKYARIETLLDGTKVCFPTDDMLRKFRVKERKNTD